MDVSVVPVTAQLSVLRPVVQVRVGVAARAPVGATTVTSDAISDSTASTITVGRAGVRSSGRPDIDAFGGTVPTFLPSGIPAGGQAAGNTPIGVGGPGLTDEDHRRALEAVLLLVDPGDLDGFGPRALRAVRHLVDCPVAAVNDVDQAAGRFVYAIDPVDFTSPEGAHHVLLELAETHPLVRHVQRTGDGSARRISDVVSREEFQASELYRRLYRQMGVEFQMSVTLDIPLPAVVAVTVSRGDVDFSERERLLLDLLRPHLAHGWRQARELARLAALAGAASPARSTGILQRPGPAGTLALALSDPVAELTDGALVELYRFFGRPSPRGALPVRVERWLAAVQAQAEASPRSLLAKVDQRHALLRRLPPGAGHPAILLLDVDVDAGPTLTALGLTDREVEVVAMLVTGATNEGIAGELHVAPGTVKKHLDHVYAKLGVHGRVQAVAVALALAGSGQ